MYSESYSLALRNALNEIKNTCPDVQTSFLFNDEGKVIAEGNEAPEASLEKTAGAMGGILEKTVTIGGLDKLIINGQKGKVYVSRVDDMYLAMVTSKDADMTYVQTVSRVLIPTVIKLLDNISPTRPKFSSSRQSVVDLPRTTKQNEGEQAIEKAIDEGDSEMNEEEAGQEPAETKEIEASSEPELIRPSDQLIVDTIGGLLVRGDNVQIDAEILDKWSQQYDGAEINEVEIESFSGNSTTCKVKPIKDSKVKGKGIIRMTEHTCQHLEVKKGELVKVKPLVDEEGT
jgi:predicted regulator of Ras-like GTPase activity (Roadblock/LC7/MglB family)